MFADCSSLHTGIFDATVQLSASNATQPRISSGGSVKWSTESTNSSASTTPSSSSSSKELAESDGVTARDIDPDSSVRISSRTESVSLTSVASVFVACVIDVDNARAIAVVIPFRLPLAGLQIAAQAGMSAINSP